MSTVNITIPSAGESITEVRLGPWRHKSGEWVQKDDIVVEIETDKTTMELPAPESGLLKVIENEGADLKVGATIGTIDPAAAKPAGAPEKKASATEAKPAAVGSSSSPSSSSGVSSAVVESSGRATPVARKMAADKGVDLTKIPGTGPSGRVTKSDVLAASGSPGGSGASGGSGGVISVSPARAEAGQTLVRAESRAVGGLRSVRRERMTKIRARIAERLVEAQHNAAMLTTFNEADMTEVMRLRSAHKEAFEKKHGVGLGFMGFFVKACVSALQAFPRVNASIIGDEVEFHDYCDISVAVGTEKGLVVPVIRNAEVMSFADVEATIKGLAGKAREGRLTVEDMTGGTFTISNGGVYGSLMSTPILNPPQSGILGMHKIMNRAVENPDKPGELTLRPMMYLALSYDHRIVDGAEAVGFLVHVKNAIEKPERLLLGV